jgi:hypothetical protein
MFQWAKLLFSNPPPHTKLTMYTAWNGVLYMVLGATFYAWPGSAQVLLRRPTRLARRGSSARWE